MIIRSIRASLGILLVATVLFGGVYPLVVLATSHVLFQGKSNGSLVERGGVVVGSELLGQEFAKPYYFWGRPSATIPPYNAASSAGSNLNPANPVLLRKINERVAALKKIDPNNTRKIPVDLVTASASGLDPHISVEAAQYQAERIAKIRKMKADEVNALISDYTIKPLLGLTGQAYVNVLSLNLALDERWEVESK